MPTLIDSLFSNVFIIYSFHRRTKKPQRFCCSFPYSTHTMNGILISLIHLEKTKSWQALFRTCQLILSSDFNLDIFVWPSYNFWSCKVSRQIDYFCLIIGTCFTFLPACLLSNANTISRVRSKKPISLFQLTPHLQWNKPINCCFIFRPQFGQTRLLLICVPPAG